MADGFLPASGQQTTSNTGSIVGTVFVANGAGIPSPIPSSQTELGTVSKTKRWMFGLSECDRQLWMPWAGK